jgi:predicted anti-sigma-YlaC factor YlaD
MTCVEVVGALSDYIDGTLAGHVHDDVERHLAVCHQCHVVLDTTQCTILLYRASRSTTLQGEQRRRLLERLEKACGGCAGDRAR